MTIHHSRGRLGDWTACGLRALKRRVVDYLRGTTCHNCRRIVLAKSRKG